MVKKKRVRSVSKPINGKKTARRKVVKRKKGGRIKRIKVTKKIQKKKVKIVKRKNIIKKPNELEVPKKPAFLKRNKIKRYKPSKPGLKLELILIFLLVVGALLTLVPFFYDIEPIIFILIGTFLALISITGKSFYLKKSGGKKGVAFTNWIKKYKTLVFVEIFLIFVLAVLLVFAYYFDDSSFSLEFGFMLNYIQYIWWGITIIFALLIVSFYIKKKKKKFRIKPKAKKVVNDAPEKPKELKKKDRKSSELTARNRKIVREIKAGVIGKKDKYKTDLDVLYEVIKTNQKVNIVEVASGFSISKEKAEEWGKILEGRGLVRIKYSLLGGIEIWKK